MFRRPSFRGHTQKGELHLNIVPILDAMVTIIAFLLFSMSFLAVVGHDTFLPTVNTKILEEKIKEKPLQLTLTITENNIELWSPFDRIKAIKIKNLPSGEINLNGLHDYLIEIKQKFPNEKQIIFLPNNQSNYEALISIMDQVRFLRSTDPAIYIKEKSGKQQVASQLFPNIVFGNLVGEG